MRTPFFLAALGLSCVAESTSARAQAYGEQAPLQFRYANQGAALEAYRQQYMISQSQAATAANSAAAAGVGSSASGQGQGSSALNNAVQLTPSTTLNLNVSGSGNTLNVTGDTVSATHNSTGTGQTSQNSQSSNKGLLN
jgi:hypothetical protein